MADTPKSHRAVILRNFTDAGTGQNYAADDQHTIEHGHFVNYERAGLVRKATAADAEPAKSSK